MSIFTSSSGTNAQAFSPADWALFLSLSLIWGSSFLLMDVGLETLRPGVITWMRVALGAAVLWLFAKARQPVEREDLPRLVVLSVMWVAVPFTLFPLAQQWINSALAGMLNGAVPIFVAIVASVMLQRLPRGAQLIGLVVGFGGVIAISLPSMDAGGTQALGVGLVLFATICYGVSVNIAVPLQQRYGSLPVMARMLAFATLWTAPLGIGGLGASTFAMWPFLAVLVLGVLGTGLAFVLAGTLLASVGATRSSFVTYLIPGVALMLGIAFRGDVVAPIAIIGAVLVVLGALLASRKEGVRRFSVKELGAPPES